MTATDTGVRKGWVEAAGRSTALLIVGDDITDENGFALKVYGQPGPRFDDTVGEVTVRELSRVTGRWLQPRP